MAVSVYGYYVYNELFRATYLQDDAVEPFIFVGTSVIGNVCFYWNLTDIHSAQEKRATDVQAIYVV